MANVFATIITKYLWAHVEGNLQTITLQSHECGQQKRNNTLSNALYHLSFYQESNITVMQKYLEKGARIDGS